MALQRDREEDLEAMLNRSSLWAVTYGDLMSYLMIFFLILFALALKGNAAMAKSLADLQAQFGGRKESAAIERMQGRDKEEAAADLVREKLYGRGLQKFVTVDVTERRIQVTLSEPVMFGSGEATLKPQAEPLLMEFAESIRDLPNMLVVEGHTDDRPVRGGAFPSNWDLSTARANSVVRFLIKEAGIDPRRLSAAGFAEFRPVGGNETAEGRAANRRIELSLLRQE